VSAKNTFGHESRCFDRASEYYDRTRSLPEDAMTKVIELLVRETKGAGACLEIGVGTGRIGIPLSAAGVGVIGIDLSAAMLAKLTEKAGGAAPFPLVRGDATRLPFTDGAFGAAVACHVLHLIPAWQNALRELVRVTRSGGKILVDPGGWRSAGSWQEMLVRFAEEAGLDSPFVGVAEPDDIDGFARGLGAHVRVLDPVPAVRTASSNEIIGQLERGVFSFTWDMQESQRLEAGRRVRAWAAGRFGSLDDPRGFDFEIRWRVYDLP
jgi:ubiquinone/menaquinone biosynthesis C-methylase UbiE